MLILFLSVPNLKAVLQILGDVLQLLAAGRYFVVVIGLMLQDFLYTRWQPVNLFVCPKYSIFVANRAFSVAGELSVGVAQPPHRFGLINFRVDRKLGVTSPEYVGFECLLDSVSVEGQKLAGWLLPQVLIISGLKVRHVLNRRNCHRWLVSFLHL